MVGYIYQIKNNVTNQSYIGQTINIFQRSKKHFNTLRNNTHENPKLQASWNKYREENFSFKYWEFDIQNSNELDQLECEYIEKFNGLSEGFNLIPGGGKPPLRQKVKDEDIVTFLCVQNKLGDGYGKTCEQIFNWSKGTASSAKLKKHYFTAWNIFDNLSNNEKEERASDFINAQKLHEIALQRQLTQGGCKKAYSLTQNDYNLAFCAQELGCKATYVAKYFGIKDCTVYDWFSGRSRNKERQKYNNITSEEKSLLIGRCKTAGLSGNPKSKSSN